MGQNKSGTLSKKLWRTGEVTSTTEILQNATKVWFKNNSIHIKFDQPLEETGHLYLYDMSGREIAGIMLGKGEYSFDLSLNGMCDGIYIYQVYSDQLKQEVKGKIVLQN